MKKHTLPTGEAVTIKRVNWNGVKVGQQLLTLRGDMPEPKLVTAVTERLSKDGQFVCALDVKFEDGTKIVRRSGESRSMWRIVEA